MSTPGFLTVIDDTPEATLALRFAARRARAVGGTLHILAPLPPLDPVAWADVAATIDAEERAEAEESARLAAQALSAEHGVTPTISVARGEPIEMVRELALADPTITTLVLATAASGAPGPLVSAFTGVDAGLLPIPVLIVPGGLSDVDIDRLS